ncbi:MAG: MarC family NAAT transporter [Saprospirales bacterium]|nr:MAG: MarC family NAAT transporter [Saprospirales bacterium]
MELFIAVFASLISIVNPLGGISIFLSLTPGYTQWERNKTALWTSFYFFLILFAFFIGGFWILGFFGISLQSIMIAGGLVIFTSGLSLLQGKISSGRAIDGKVRKEALQSDDISFSPMAMPMLAGPGSISLLISLQSEHTAWDERAIITLVIIATSAVVWICLKSATYLYKILGEGGIKGISRIMGFIVMAIGVQYIINGVFILLDQIN